MKNEKKKISIVRSKGYEFSIVTIEKRDENTIEGVLGTVIESNVYLTSAKRSTHYEHRAMADRIPLRSVIRQGNELSDYYILLNKSMRGDVERNMRNNPQKYLQSIEKIVDDYDFKKKAGAI